MQKILLYYKFTPLADPESVKLWQKTLCDSLNLRGRILVSHQGLNGTIGGEIDDLKKYIKETKKLPGFKDIVFKWSNGDQKAQRGFVERARQRSPRKALRVRSFGEFA